MSDWGSNDWMIEQDANDFFGGDIGASTDNFNYSSGADQYGSLLGNLTSGTGWQMPTEVQQPSSFGQGGFSWDNLMPNTPMTDQAMTQYTPPQYVGSAGEAFGDNNNTALANLTNGSSSWINENLGKLLQNPDKMMGGLAKIFAALEERKSNKGASRDYLNAIRSMQQSQMLDPAAQMRGTAIQQFDQAVADPMSVPIVRDQINEINRQQAIKDAAAGRRSNMAGSAPATTAAAGAVIQNYLNGMSKMYSPPNSSALAQMYSGAMPAYQMANQGNSPLWSAIGSISNQDALNQKIAEAVAKAGKTP